MHANTGRKVCRKTSQYTGSAPVMIKRLGPRLHLPGWHHNAHLVTGYPTGASGCQPGRCSGSCSWIAPVPGSDGPVLLIVVVLGLVMMLVAVVIIVLMLEVVAALMQSTDRRRAPPRTLVELARHRASKTDVGVTGHTDRHGRHDGRHAGSPRDSSTRPRHSC